jgi:hypothetical protein
MPKRVPKDEACRMLSFPAIIDFSVAKQHHPTIMSFISKLNAIQNDILLPRLAREEHVK